MSEIIEQFTYSMFAIVEPRESKIRKGHVHNIETGFLCPKCATPHPALTHGETTQCHNCMLRMTKFGNSLTCSLDERYL
jgi:hypothetical protein